MARIEKFVFEARVLMDQIVTFLPRSTLFSFPSP